MSRDHVRTAASGVGLVVLVTVSAVVTSWLVGRTITAVAGDRMAPWILGRSAGIASYLLLVALSCFIYSVGATMLRKT